MYLSFSGTRTIILFITTGYLFYKVLIENLTNQLESMMTFLISSKKKYCFFNQNVLLMKTWNCINVLKFMTLCIQMEIFRINCFKKRVVGCDSSSGRNHPQIHFHRHSADRALDLVFPGRGPGSDIGRTGEAHAAVPTHAKTISIYSKNRRRSRKSNRETYNHACKDS